MSTKISKQSPNLRRRPTNRPKKLSDKAAQKTSQNNQSSTIRTLDKPQNKAQSTAKAFIQPSKKELSDKAAQNKQTINQSINQSNKPINRHRIKSKTPTQGFSPLTTPGESLFCCCEGLGIIFVKMHPTCLASSLSVPRCLLLVARSRIFINGSEA